MANTEQIKNYINLIYPLAQYEVQKRCLPKHLAMLCLTQGALESGYGTSSVMSKYYALFGVKATQTDIKNGAYYTTATKEYINGQYVTVTANFRAFKNYAENVKYYFDLITNTRYGSVKLSKNVHEAFVCVKACGYATSPTYVDTLEGVYKVLENHLKAYVDITFNYIVNTEHDPLNVRQLPDINSKIIGTIPKNEKIYINDEWVYVPKYEGFVNTKYIRRL